MKVADACGHFVEDLPYPGLLEEFVLSTVFLKEEAQVAIRAKLSLDEQVAGLFPSLDERNDLR